MPFILVAVLIDMLSVGLIIPVLPTLVGSFTTSPAAQTLAYGAVVFAYGFASFFGAPILGALSDRYGRRPVMLIGFAGLAINFFATALATSLAMLIVVRVVAGAMQANAAVAQAYIADISAPEERARRFGLMGAMFGIGYTLGPVMGGILGAVDVHLPFFVAGGLAVLNSLYGLFVLPESLPPERRTAADWKRANPISALRDLTVLRGIAPLVWVIALASLAQFTMHMTWVLYTTFKFGWGPKENGWSLFAVGIMAVIVQGGLMRMLLKRWPAERLASLGLVSFAACYLLWGLAAEGWMMIAVIGLNLFGFAAAASMQSIVSNAASDDAQGRTMGAVASLNSAMAVLAPMVGTSLLGLVSHRPQGDLLIGLPFYVCALLQAVAAFIAIRHFQRRPAAPLPATAT